MRCGLSEASATRELVSVQEMMPRKRKKEKETETEQGVSYILLCKRTQCSPGDLGAGFSRDKEESSGRSAERSPDEV